MPATNRTRSRLLLLLLCCAGVYLVGNRSVPLWDRDEPRFAQTSRQMLQSGDWVVPRLYDAVRTAKPPLIYWLQAWCMKAFGDQGETGVFAARLPSAVAMTLTLAVVAWTLWRHVGPRHALWTVLILSSCVLVVMAAKAGLTDSVLLLFVTVAQLCLYAVWRGRGTWGVTVVMAIAIALALLTKGPVAVGVQAMTLLALGALRLTLRWTSGESAPRGFEPVFDDTAAKAAPAPAPASVEMPAPTVVLTYGHTPARGPAGIARAAAKLLVGLAIILAVGLPWVYLVEHRHPGFILTAFNHEIRERAATGLEGHKGWPGYYLISIWPMFLPWSLVLPLAIVTAWKRRRDPKVRFALAAVAGPWLMFEVVQTKLPHYLLPCFPPLAFLAADAIIQFLRPAAFATPLAPSRPGRDLIAATDAASPNPFEDRGFLTGVAVWAVIAIGLGLAPWAAAKWFRPLPWLATGLLSLGALVYGLAVAAQFYRSRPGPALATLGGGMLGLSALLYGAYLPRAPFLRLSSETARALRDEGATGTGRVAMLDYKEPSLAFYQGGTIREETALIVSDRLLETCPPWLVITEEVYRSDRTRRPRLEVVARFRGLDLSASLRVVEVLVVKKRPEADAYAPSAPLLPK